MNSKALTGFGNPVRAIICLHLRQFPERNPKKGFLPLFQNEPDQQIVEFFLLFLSV